MNLIEYEGFFFSQTFGGDIINLDMNGLERRIFSSV
jgi:hypothetical protein